MSRRLQKNRVGFQGPPVSGMYHASMRVHTGKEHEEESAKSSNGGMRSHDGERKCWL